MSLNLNEWLCILVVVLIFRKVIDVLYRKKHNYPPGSVGIPFIGLFIRGLSYPPNYIRLSELYTPITMYYIGFSKIIHVHDFKIMKEILNKKEFYQNRHSMSEMGFGNVDSFATESGQKWSMRRKYAQSSLLTILNYQYLDQLILKALHNDIFKKLNQLSETDNVWYCKNDVYYLSLSSIYAATFGKEMNYDNPEVSLIRHPIQKFIGNIGMNMLLGLLSDTIPAIFVKSFGKYFSDQK
eukprot:261395_1